MMKTDFSTKHILTIDFPKMMNDNFSINAIQKIVKNANAFFSNHYIAFPRASVRRSTPFDLSPGKRHARKQTVFRASLPDLLPTPPRVRLRSHRPAHKAQDQERHCFAIAQPYSPAFTQQHRRSRRNIISK
jgi:hypothetical protein